jgi:phosphatidylcholine synthase
MNTQENGPALTTSQWFRAFSIHILTASGAVWAFLALIAAADNAWPQMFFWLGVALFVDAIDGPLARRINLAEILPRWSGEILDLIVDFATYVFVPAYAITASGLLPHALSLAAGVAIVMTSAIYFSDRRMKTEDNYFQGFPAIWNAAAFYLLLLTPTPLFSTAFVAALMVMTFLPIPFIHPLRVVRMRRFNIALLVIWSVLALITMAQGMAPGPWVTYALCLIGVYVLGGGFLRRTGNNKNGGRYKD